MAKKESKKKTKRKIKLLNAIVSVILLISSLFLLFRLYDKLPNKYFAIAALIFILVDVMLISVLNRRFKLWIKAPFMAVTIVFIVACLFGAYNLIIQHHLLNKL